MKPAQFRIGDVVRYPAFVNCFGVDVAQVDDLTVTDVRLIVPTCGTLAPYYRVTAIKDGPVSMVEASERFFEAMPAEVAK